MSVNGPIRLSPNHRYFVDASGQPFFWLGDTAWPLFALYTKEEAEQYLDNRAQKGFTVIQCVITWGAPDISVSWSGTGPGPNRVGEYPWLDGSPTKPNPKYFEHVDYLVDYADRRGLVLALLPTWGHNVTDTRALNRDNAYEYGRWVGSRYRDARNIVWVNGGDREATGFEDVFRDLARGLREGDGGTHLITYHPCGWRSSSYYFHSEDWLDFNMIQTWTAWPSIHPAVLSDLLLVPPKPVVLAEGAYENGPEYPMGPITPAIIRRQAWWAFTAGGFYTNGQYQMWRVEPGWTETFNTPGTNQMTIFRQIASSVPWWDMVADQGIYASGVQSERYLNTAMRTLDRTKALLYLSTQCRFVLWMDRFAAQSVRATWVNPQNGEMKDGGTYPTGSPLDGTSFPKRRTECFTVADFWEDAVLLLEKAE